MRFVLAFTIGTLLVPAGVLWAQPVSSHPDSNTVRASWFRKISLSGTLSGEFRWMRRLDAVESDAGGSTDLYIRRMELGIETAMTGGLSATAVINSEYLGDEINQGDDDLKVDEVHFDLQIPRAPFYLVVGKRTQPFGVFEDYFVTDPMTYDAYSTSVVGATVGYTGPAGLDLSFTLYKGPVQMDQLFESGLFDTVSVERSPSENHLTSSYIASATVAPWSEYLTVFGAFLSEPAADRRDLSVDVGLSFKTPGFENVLIDGEYIKAIQRETYRDLGRSFEEGVLSVTGSYQFVVRPRALHGSGNYRNRSLSLEGSSTSTTIPWQKRPAYGRRNPVSRLERSTRWSKKAPWLFTVWLSTARRPTGSQTIPSAPRAGRTTRSTSASELTSRILLEGKNAEERHLRFAADHGCIRDHGRPRSPPACERPAPTRTDE
jgi:hypothetical protein